MKRRDFLGGICGVVMTPAVAWARDYSDGIVRELKRNGYRIDSVARTLLGRVKIVASNRRGVREIIVNPATGEILRDLWVSGGFDPGAIDDAYEVDEDEDEDEGEVADKEKEEDKKKEEEKEKEDKDNSGKGDGEND